MVDNVTDEFCFAWRKALKRLLNLPYNSHSFLLPLLTNTLPIFVEICRRSARFILNCLNNASSLVQTVARHGIHFGRYNSCVGRNLLFCCDYFKWQLNDFLDGKVPLNYLSISNFYNDHLSNFKISNASSLFEVLRVRDGGLFVENVYHTEIESIINVMST